MSNRKLAKTIQNLSREVQRLYRNFNRGIVNWLLRSAFVAHRRGQSPVAGFVLPVVTLLLLVVTLTVGAMTLRAFDRNVQVIAESQQKVIYNAATPAIDRARSKLEFLFDQNKDPRYPGGVPLESRLLDMMTNKDDPLKVDDKDAYTLPGEERVSVGENDDTNAWRYRADTDGDGTNDATVLYSIVFRTPSGTGGASAATELLTLSDQEKANQGIVRGGPISNQSSLTGCGSNAAGTANELTAEKWFEDPGNSSRIRKNFQIDAMVIPDKAKGAAVTLEFQQDRQIQRGNKWGAWFRYDLEIFPGKAFNWNGAMHTEGNLMFGQAQGSKTSDRVTTAYLISAPKSCLYQKESSEISATQIDENTVDKIPEFVGHAVFGMVGGVTAGGGDGTYDGGRARFDIHPQGDGAPTEFVDMDRNQQFNSSNNPKESILVASNPASIVLTENSRGVGEYNTKPLPTNNNKWSKLDSVLNRRIENKPAAVPYVDDLYRADNRYGPKAKYKNGEVAKFGVPDKVGADIKNNKALTENDSDPVAVGLDGYWERRARSEGMRVLVGERLELGNIGGWQTPRNVNGNDYIDANRDAYDPTKPIEITPNTDLDGDPLYPITIKPYPVRNAGVSVPHLVQQRRSLRDNLPAVQAAAVYHSAINADKDYPVACLAMTIHPGTVDTLRQSTNFMPTRFASGATGTAATPEYLLSDFFTGRGTNGWEFSTPGGNAGDLITALGDGKPLRIALENLAHFAGDPLGAYPPTQGAVTHPYPAVSMWGNFSNLRRALKELKDKGGYANISPADKTYIHTAACSLGMLAYEVDTVQKFDTTNVANNSIWNNQKNWKRENNKKVLTDLAIRLKNLMDGDVTNGEVLSKAQLSTYKYNAAAADEVDKTTLPPGVPKPNPYNPRDYDNVPPEAYISALKQQDMLRQFDYLNDPEIRMAEMIMLSNQIRRDRTFGFRPSPIFGEYAIIKSGDGAGGNDVQFFPTACDPDLFALHSVDNTDSTIASQTNYQYTGSTTSVRVPIIGQLPLNAAGGLKALTPTYDDAAALPGAVASDFDTLSAQRLALSRLCGAVRVPEGYDPKLNPQSALTVDGRFNPAARPVVMPKFPSLYYIFPEVTHDLKGALEAALDHRQPGAIDADVPTPVAATGVRSPALNPARVASLKLPANDAEFNAASKTAQLGLDPYDREPYIVDPNVTTAMAGYKFEPVTPTASTAVNLLAYPVPGPANLNPLATRIEPELKTASYFLSRFPYAGTSPLPVADLPVGAIALTPRQIEGFPAVPGAIPAVLPGYAPKGDPKGVAEYTSPNRIQIPKDTAASLRVDTLSQEKMPTKPWAVPFLDRAMFDGRQLQVARVTDIDLAMLRSIKPTDQFGKSEFAGKDTWLPMSGVVYGFREDAVREDAIARPTIGGTGILSTRGPKNLDTEELASVKDELTRVNTALVEGNATNLTKPAAPYDPSVRSKDISIKAIDYVPDPDRRVHGFRLRNGAQLKRNDSAVGDNQSKNTKGLSFFTDQPVYVQGDFNLHQSGADDTVGTLLEEFTSKLFDNPVPNYTAEQYRGAFYGRTERDPNFAKAGDRWRPTEILADAVSILSKNHCDGSIADTFTTPLEPSKRVPNYNVTAANVPTLVKGDFKQSMYIDPGNSGGLYLYGCDDGTALTSFGNQNRVTVPPSSANQGWDWKREGASFTTSAGPDGNKKLATWADFTTPVQIGRLGEVLLEPRPLVATGGKRPPLLPVNYGLEGLGNPYLAPTAKKKGVAEGQNGGDEGRLLIPASDMRMNGIIVSGIPPSRKQQSYGGLHNFPRFLQTWYEKKFIYSGSFVQLNFSNYATGPFEQEAWEPGDLRSDEQKDWQFYPPNRLWGYDVALQFAPAGPAAARFVTPLATRSEFYTEPPVTDPYIKRLCGAARKLNVKTTCPA